MVFLFNLRPESLFSNTEILGSDICYKIDHIILHSNYIVSVFLFLSLLFAFLWLSFVWLFWKWFYSVAQAGFGFVRILLPLSRKSLNYMSHHTQLSFDLSYSMLWSLELNGQSSLSGELQASQRPYLKRQGRGLPEGQHQSNLWPWAGEFMST